MSKTTLEAKLKYWRAKHKFRQDRLDAAHVRNDSAGITKWHGLLVEAGIYIRKYEKQLHPDPPPRSSARSAIVAAAQQAAANYRANPAAYHYLAGGIANTEILKPTGRNYRSDCSQFAVNVYRVAGVKCPGTGTYLYSNTITIAGNGTVTTNPQPGDLGMYGSRWAPHHVEVVVDSSPLTFIGHGTQPIDSRTPGLPSYYLTFPQLDA